MIRPSAIWLWDYSATAYSDLTNNVKTNSSVTFLADAEDTIYIGLERRYEGFVTDLSTNGSYSGLSYEYQASDSSWKYLSLIDSYNFDKSKYIRWVIPDDWMKINFLSGVPQSATPPDTVERYWIRIKCSSVTTAAIISKLRLIPYAMYSTPKKVAEILQLKFDFNSSTKPTDLTVEDFIRRAEDYIDYTTYKSWKFNAVNADEDINPILQDYNRYGFFTRHRNLYKVYKISIWNGASWQELSEGRSAEYFVDYNRGMIYLTRLWLLPAAYGMVGRYYHWGFGEFKMSVKIDYAYGRNWETDPEFRIVEEIVTRKAAIELLRHHDYSKFVVSGTDKVPIERKIELMQKDIDEKMEKLQAVAIF